MCPVPDRAASRRRSRAVRRVPGETLGKLTNTSIDVEATIFVRGVRLATY